MAKNSESYSSFSGRWSSASEPERDGIVRSWRKSRFGRHLSKARKCVLVFAIPGGCDMGCWTAGFGREKAAGSWERRSSGTVVVGWSMCELFATGTLAPSKPWPGATCAVDEEPASSSNSRSISSALTGNVLSELVAVGAASSMSRSISSALAAGAVFALGSSSSVSSDISSWFLSDSLAGADWASP